MGELFNFTGIFVASIALVIAVFCAWLNRNSNGFFIYGCFSIAFIGVLIREVLTWLK